MLSLLGSVLAILLIISIIFHFTDEYSDDQNRLILIQDFLTLLSLESTPDKVKVVDELLVNIEKFSDKNDEVLMINGIPIFYYLAETKPIMGNPWLFQEPIKDIKVKQQQLSKEGRYPKLFIYSKVNTRDWSWPNTNLICSNDDCVKLDYLKEEYIKKLNYDLLWENNAFSIYTRS